MKNPNSWPRRGHRTWQPVHRPLTDAEIGLPLLQSFTSLLTNMQSRYGVDRPLWYDKQGKPIEDRELSNRLFNDFDYKRVAETTITTALGDIWISTVWLGLDHGWRDDMPPLIFETMVFDHGDYGEMGMDLDCERYPTEAAALAGHDRMVAEVRDALTLKELEIKESE